jgi:type II secretory pathway component PulJ
MASTNRARRARGFSTAEILAASALSLFILGAIYSFHKAQMQAMAAQNAYAESQNVTRSVLDIMAREIRMSSFDPAGTALANSPGPSCPGVERGLVEAMRHQIRIQQDLDGDGTIASSSEDVVYDLLGDTLRRTDGANLPVDLVSGVGAFGFVLQYFDGSNPPLELVPTGSPPALTQSQRDCVTKVRITIHATQANPDPNNPTPIASLAETEVAIRHRSLMNF